MSTLLSPRHRAPSTPLSRSTWHRVRLTLTVGLFSVATVAGVVVGLQGAVVSPVAPTTPVAAVAALPVHHDHGPRR